MAQDFRDALEPLIDKNKGESYLIHFLARGTRITLSTSNGNFSKFYDSGYTREEMLLEVEQVLRDLKNG